MVRLFRVFPASVVRLRPRAADQLAEFLALGEQQGFPGEFGDERIAFREVPVEDAAGQQGRAVGGWQ